MTGFDGGREPFPIDPFSPPTCVGIHQKQVDAMEALMEEETRKVRYAEAMKYYRSAFGDREGGEE